MGGATLLAYAIYKEDPVFIVGQGAGLLIYSRNLYFIRRAGGAVLEVPVNHRPRAAGASHYGMWGRAWVGLDDMLGVAWLQRRAKNPIVEEMDE